MLFRSKVSYAASFGLEKFPPQYLEIYKKGLKKFGSLSVRESSGQTIIKELTGRDSEVVLDPTFLVNKNEWDEVASSPSKFRIKNYLLLFLLPGSIQLGTIKDYLEYFVKGTEIQIVSIGNNIDKLKSNFKIISTAGPREFLWLIKNANYIVTNSFHGTAFSIIFEKNFYTLLNNNERDSRLVEIVNKLELGDRLINPQTNKCILGLNQIDYYLVKNILDKEIDKSLVFLNSSIFKSC